MRLNAGRFTENPTSGKQGIIFFHIPKAGGSSVASAIKRHFRLSNFNVRSQPSTHASQTRYQLPSATDGYNEQVQDLRASLVFYTAHQNIKFITGHIWFLPEMLHLKASGYRLVTFLRDPVDRFYSDYFYRRYKEVDYCRTMLDFDAFLESPEAQNIGATYIRFVGGPRQDRNYTSDEAIQHAENRLKDFDVIGFLDRIDLFQVQAQNVLGLKLHVGHKRKSPARKNPAHQKLMTECKNSLHYRRKIAEICAPDIAFYEYARKHYLPHV